MNVSDRAENGIGRRTKGADERETPTDRRKTTGDRAAKAADRVAIVGDREEKPADRRENLRDPAENAAALRAIGLHGGELDCTTAAMFVDTNAGYDVRHRNRNRANPST
jgi:hypothetical protein